MRHLNVLIFIISFVSQIFSQSESTNTPFYYKEKQEDAYLANEFHGKKTSKAYQLKNDFFFSTQVNINSESNNVVGDAANEPSIAIDPNNPDRMIIGWRQFDNIKSNFRQAGIAYSTNGGDHWIYSDNIESGIFRSDPVLDSDNEGNFYYNSLTVVQAPGQADSYPCTVFKSGTSGSSWSSGVDARGGDKQWMVIDKSKNESEGNIYSKWSGSYSTCHPQSFTRSFDAALSFEYCSDASIDPQWGSMAIGNAGDVYIGGAAGAGIAILKSQTAKDPSLDVNWTGGFINLDGVMTAGGPMNPVGLIGQLYIDVDKSKSIGPDVVYALASVTRNNSDPADVMFTKSLDGAKTWEAPVRINKDESITNFQWFGTMAVSPDGRIDVIWLDTRDESSGEYWSSLYYSFSLDQGENWSIDYRLSDAFDPHIGWPNQQKMGDYFHMISDNEFAHLAWANTFNGEQDIYYGRISPPLATQVVELDTKSNLNSFLCFPNPSTGQLQISFDLINTSIIEFNILDISGRVLKITDPKRYLSGKQNVLFQLHDLDNGMYICQVKLNGIVKHIKFILNM